MALAYYDFRAMNSAIVLAAEGPPERVNLGFMATQTCIAAEEMRFTRFSPASELSRLNAAAGHWFQPSAPMFEVLQEALSLSSETSGLFNPCILSDLEAAGYDRSMDEIQARDSESCLRGAIDTLNRTPLPVVDG